MESPSQVNWIMAYAWVGCGSSITFQPEKKSLEPFWASFLVSGTIVCLA